MANKRFVGTIPYPLRSGERVIEARGTCVWPARQGSPVDWVAALRAHHAHTDTDGDPHDANAGFRWSHFCSTNCWWVALLGWDEGWHSHRAFPFSVRHGLRWYELDVTWLLVKVLAFFRLATDLKLPTPQMMRRLRIK